MRVVITHTDLRLYWPARILALQQALESRGDELFVVEIAGAGRPYAFGGSAGGGSGKPSSWSAGGDAGAVSGMVRNWITLYPATRMEDIPPARACRQLVAKLNELAPDVVLSGSFAYPSGAAAVYWARRNNKPVIIFDDVRPENVPRNFLVNYIKRLLYGQVDAILCPASPWTAAFVHWGFKPEQVFFGVDVVDNSYWKGNGVLTGGKSPVGGKFLLAVGRQIPTKNFVFLLHVYERYRAVVKDCLPLVMVGEGPERRMLESFIIARGLEGVHFFPFVQAERLRTFYHEAAALVLPSRSETWGLVVNEAMASGLPVLVSKTCGCASVLVKEGVNGYTFAPDILEEMLSALISFSKKNVTARAAMGKASQRMIQDWGLDRFVKGSLDAINYSMASKRKKWSKPVSLLLKGWKGRYRPV